MLLAPIYLAMLARPHAFALEGVKQQSCTRRQAYSKSVAREYKRCSGGPEMRLRYHSLCSQLRSNDVEGIRIDVQIRVWLGWHCHKIPARARYVALADQSTCTFERCPCIDPFSHALPHV